MPFLLPFWPCDSCLLQYALPMLAASQGLLPMQAKPPKQRSYHLWQQQILPIVAGFGRSHHTCSQQTTSFKSPNLQPVRLKPIAVSYADPVPAQADQPAPTGAVAAPATSPLAAPQSWQHAGQGLTWFADGSCSFKVWAPHAQAVTLQVGTACCTVPAK